jgi:hypothetical protein
MLSKTSEVSDQFFDIMDMNIRPVIRDSQFASQIDKEDVEDDLKELLDEIEDKKRTNRIDISQGAFIDTLSMYNKT